MEEHQQEEELHDVTPISGMYENWFLDYASYVILERAVPAVSDGLKPVHRRILHAMKEMDDGRYNKVANIIGSTMQYHPHGDASISDAIIHLGQKELLIDTQGNWGDIRTGDAAAASRYIEARLSKFALEVVYNPQTTIWQLSYDGRKKEPITLPVKFPLLLAQGVEGIAVGLSTKILPHNFCEIIDGSIAILKGKRVQLYPDFLTGGKMDVADYNDGRRGGKVRVRATIVEQDTKTLLIKNIPYGITTTSLIESIIKANEKGKIKIKQVIDNTAKDIEIVVLLTPGSSPDITIDALYAFTDCEISISPNACVIVDEKPGFLSVSDILEQSVHQTVELLKRELEIKKQGLLEKILFGSLEKLFIEHKIYRDIEECETWEEVLKTIDQGLEPFKPQFYREIREDDIVRLTEIKIKRISKFDSFKATEWMRKLEEELRETTYHLTNLIDYAIAYYQNLLVKYGKGKERKTEIANFDTIQATVVAANNARLYINRKDGFVGYGLKKDEFVCECSDIDDVIAFTSAGKCVVTRIQEKVFVGKNILHVGIFKKHDKRMVYNMAYLDSQSGRSYVKRFQVFSATRDRQYDLTKKGKGKVHYFTANPNGEAEIVTVYLAQTSKARKKVFDFDFCTLEIKGRSTGGNILTQYSVRKISLKKEGKSTLGGLDIWFDPIVGRLNREKRGLLLGNFDTGDQIIAFYNDGTYETTDFELTNHYDFDRIIGIYKYKLEAHTVFNAIYYAGETKTYFVKRFVIETNTMNKRFSVITETRGSKLVFISKGIHANVEIIYKEGRKRKTKKLNLIQLIGIKSWKAMGNRLPVQNLVKVNLIENKKVDISSIEAKAEPEMENEQNQSRLFENNEKG